MGKRAFAALVACAVVMGFAVPPRAEATENKAAKFRHPGVQFDRKQLEYVRARLKKQPYKRAFAALKKDPLASLKGKPHAWAKPVCEPFGVGSNGGCAAELHDSKAAYATALMWYLTKDRRYLRKSKDYMNAWSRTLKGRSGGDAPLQAGWAAVNWARAAELVRHSAPKGAGWQQAGRFKTMLRRHYLPWTIDGYHLFGMNGNWDLALADATVAMGVFLDDHKAFERGIQVMKSRVPAYFYLKSDGPRPHQPVEPVWDLDTYWYQPCSETADPRVPEADRRPCGPGQRVVYLNGQTQETCRDRLHATYGIAAVMQLAATARIQGRNLFPSLRERIVAASELTAKLNVAGVPANLCGGRIGRATGAPAAAFEIVWREYHRKNALPWTGKMLARQRPGTVREFVAWETLTNARD